jgi:hypothetical protein
MRLASVAGCRAQSGRPTRRVRVWAQPVNLTADQMSPPGQNSLAALRLRRREEAGWLLTSGDAPSRSDDHDLYPIHSDDPGRHDGPSRVRRRDRGRL